MTDLDPYAELGVPRDADEKAVRRAYREKVRAAHPDAGGTEEAFARVSTALAVLTHPGRRKTYDDTGRIEEDKPDNDRAAALQVIDMHVGGVVNEFIASGLKDRAKDPRQIDMVEAVRALIAGELQQAEEGIVGGERIVAFFRDMKTRFKIKNPGAGSIDEDPIVRSFDRQIAHAEQQIRDIHQTIRIRKLAHEIVGGYDFKRDPTPEEDYHAGRPTAYSFSGQAGGVGGVFFLDTDPITGKPWSPA